MRTFTSGLVLFLAAGALAIAHHGLAAFDQTNTVTLKGTVTAFHFVNPHAVVEFEVKDDKGHVQEWHAEMTSPVHLKGWTATSLEPGNVVTVTGYRAKSGAFYLWVTNLSSSNGVELGALKFVGTREPFQTLLDSLEAGQPLAEFLDDFPTISRDQAVAALEQAKEALFARARPAPGSISGCRRVSELASRIRGTCPSVLKPGRA